MKDDLVGSTNGVQGLSDNLFCVNFTTKEIIEEKQNETPNIVNKHFKTQSVFLS